jgi:hypothetical protein
MDDRNERIAAALEAVFRTYQQSDRGDEEAVARERIERARVYFEAVTPYEIRDVEAGCRTLLSGSAPGVNPNYLPPAPVVAAECRRQMNLRLDRENRERKLRPALPPPEIEHSPESRARVKALVEGLTHRLSVDTEAEESEAAARRKALAERTNERFFPDMDEREMEERLGFSAGDPEDHEAAA